MIRILKTVFALSLALAGAAVAQDELLPVEEAFKYVVTDTGEAFEIDLSGLEELSVELEGLDEEISTEVQEALEEAMEELERELDDARRDAERRRGGF